MKVVLIRKDTKIVAGITYLNDLTEVAAGFTSVEISENDTTDYMYRKYENGQFSEEKYPPIESPQEPSDFDLIKQENEQLREQMTHLNADFQGFMDFYFSNL